MFHFDLNSKIGAKSEAIVETSATVEDDEPVNVGLVVGILVFVIIILVVAVVIYHKKNTMLKTELNGPEVLFFDWNIISSISRDIK